MGKTTELPKYVCHKQVRAAKIKAIEYDDKGAVITPAECGLGDIRVGLDFLHRHSPQVGGYFVQYEDGYTSFSPAKAFEEGYTRAD